MMIDGLHRCHSTDDLPSNTPSKKMTVGGIVQNRHTSSLQINPKSFVVWIYARMQYARPFQI
jgi:hypothetical protein